jgi:hypothetical protein
MLIPVILVSQEAEIRKAEVQSIARPLLYETLSQKQPTQKRAVKVAQVVGCLPRKHWILISNMSTIKKRKRKSETELCWIGKRFSRRLSVPNTSWNVSLCQDLRDGNGNSTSPYYPL